MDGTLSDGPVFRALRKIQARSRALTENPAYDSMSDEPEQVAPIWVGLCVDVEEARAYAALARDTVVTNFRMDPENAMQHLADGLEVAVLVGLIASQDEHAV